MGGGGSGGGGQSNTVTQVQQIPAFAEQFAKENQAIAASVASRPYPTYDGQLIAGFTPMQQAGMQATGDAAFGYQPALDYAQLQTVGAGQQWNPMAAQQYMSPYAMAALAPQMQQLALNQAQNRLNIGRNSTQAGAFGDARQGVAESLNDFYGDLAMNDLMAQGMNSAYGSGMEAFQADQARQLQAAQQMGNMAGLQQQLGMTGANALFGVGTQEQQLQQQQLNTSYQNFLNQVNWPVEQLNLRIASLGTAPYSTTRLTSQAPTNATAQNIGAFASLAGGLGSLFGGGGSGSSRIGVGSGYYGGG